MTLDAGSDQNKTRNETQFQPGESFYVMRSNIDIWLKVLHIDQFSGRGIYKYVHPTLQQMHQQGWMWIIAWDLVPVEAIYLHLWNRVYDRSVESCIPSFYPEISHS